MEEDEKEKKKSINKQITKIKVNNQWIWGKGTVGSGYLKFTTPPDEFSSIPTPGVWEKEKKKEKEGLPSTHFQHAEFQTSASCIQESQALSGGSISALPQSFHQLHWDLLAKVEQKNCKKTGKA